MITDDRLKELIKKWEDALWFEPNNKTASDTLFALTELQSSRQTIKRLVADGEALVERICGNGILISHGATYSFQDLISAHNTLIAELKGEQK